MKKLVMILTVLLWTYGTATAAELNVRVNRSEIPEGETFMLTLELNGGTTNATPDLNMLNEDFTTYSVSNAYRTNIINGQMSQTRQWNLVLMPNKTGKLVIPAIKIGNLESNPVEIRVLKAGETTVPSPQGDQQPRFKIEGSADNLNPYVQQQVNYTLTILDSGGLQGEAPLFMGNGNEWIIRNLGEP